MHFRLNSRRLACAIASLSMAVIALLAPAIASADTTFKINGGGYGHGIGLSQYGAKGYAEQGWPYTDILRWYYGADKTGVKAGVGVKTLKSLGYYENPYVRVHIDKSKAARSSWVLRGWKSRLGVRSLSSTTTVYLTTDAYHTFKVSGTKVSVAGKTFASPVIVTPEVADEGLPPLTVVQGASGPFSYTYVRYRGRMRLSVSGTALKAVNEVRMEDYLYGVVPRESPASWHFEALKAQAVAARSYAWGTNKPEPLTTYTLGGELYCTTYSQVYGGHSRLKSGTTPYGHEDSRTNSAVNATAGQVVYHAPSSTVVTTYFSSSSGGHTASVQDVWLSGSAKPYLAGVKDADKPDNPHYTWPTVSTTGAGLADKLRAKDGSTRDYSVAYPARVTKVVLEKASSGYVRYATFYWSNGASYKVSGDTVRSALGLRSTKFSITPVIVWHSYQQTNSNIRWGGTWTSVASKSLLGGSYKYSSRSTGVSVISFRGTGFRWITTKYPTGGYGDVYLDGVKVSRVNLYSASTKYRQTVWSKSGLSTNTTHTVIVHNTGKRPSGSRGTNVGVDGVHVMSGGLVAARWIGSYLRSDDSDSRVIKLGTWTTHADPGSWSGAYAASESKNASVTARFTGNRIRVLTRKSPASGKALVYLDSRAPVTIDTYSSAATSRQTMWDSGSIPFGTHTIRIVNAGSRNASATATSVAVDGFDVWVGSLIR